MLPRRAFGSTGLSVSVLGLGTVKLGRATGVKYPEPFAIPDDRAASALIDRARSLGINLIDTAPAYGAAEERLGVLLAGQRDDWIIATKAGEEFDTATASSRYDFSPSAVRGSVERSLRRLRTDRIDIVLLHSDGRDEWILRESGALDALVLLKDQGKARAVGISTKTPAGALLAGERCDAVMLTLNPAETADLPAVRRAHERSVGVLIKKALAGGHLARHAAAPADPVEASFRMILAEPGVSSIIVGTINPDHLEHNARAAADALTPPA